MPLLKKPHLFYEPQLTQQCKKYTLATQQEPTPFKNFPANMFLVGVRKKTCTIPLHLHKKLLGFRLNDFLKAAHCLGLVKCFKIFHFN